MDVNNVKQQLLDSYAECLESQGEDAANRFLLKRSESLFEIVINEQADPRDRVSAYSVLMDLAFPTEEREAECRTA